MGRLLLKLLIGFLLVVGLGTSGTLGYLSVQLRKERDGLQGEVRDLNKKVALLRKKYGAEKGRAANLSQTKQALEGKLRRVEGEIAAIQEEKDSILSEKESLEKKIKKLEKGSLALKGELEAVAEKHTRLQTACDEAKQGFMQQINECEKEKSELTTAKQSLEFELDKTIRHLGRCESNNAELCVIADELVESYESKGVVGSIFQKEPLLQFKKVEIEKFAQEYKEKIDEQQLKTME